MEKAEKYGAKKFTLDGLRYYWFNKPLVDLAPVLVMMNRGRFAGSSISGFSEKPGSATVPRLYHEGRYPEILEYVNREKDETLALFDEVRSVLEAFGDGRHRGAPAPAAQ